MSIIGEAHYNPDTKETDYLPEDKNTDKSQNTGDKDPYDNGEYADGLAERNKMNDEDIGSKTIQWIKDHKTESIIASSFVVLVLLACACISCMYCKKKSQLSERGGENIGSMMIPHTVDNSMSRDFKEGMIN